MLRGLTFHPSGTSCCSPSRAAVERETAAWVHWFNTERLHSAIGYRPPVEFENNYRHTATPVLEVA